MSFPTVPYAGGKENEVSGNMFLKDWEMAKIMIKKLFVGTASLLFLVGCGITQKDLDERLEKEMSELKEQVRQDQSRLEEKVSDLGGNFEEFQSLHDNLEKHLKTTSERITSLDDSKADREELLELKKMLEDKMITQNDITRMRIYLEEK